MMAEGAPEPTRVVGRYVLHGVIAAGGMATVHLGQLRGPAGFTRTVAIKRLHPQFAQDPEFVSMFLDEARLAARVQHPNVVQTLDVFTSGDEVFLVMDYVRGISLARLLKLERDRAERAPRPVALALIHDALEGLQAAHEACDHKGAPMNIVHRDVSPQNILVGADGRARVLDFGVAKAAGRAHQTRDGALKGKLAYMAPEQLDGKVEQRTDVFAASVVLWELLTGRRLLHRDTEVETLMEILALAPEPPSAHAPEVEAALDAVVMKGLEMRPRDRHATARSMADEIARFPRATPHEVTAWLEGLAGSELAERARQVSDLESTPARTAVPLQIARATASERTAADVMGPTATAPMPFAPGRVPAAVPTTAAPPSPRRRGGRALGPVVAVLLLGGGAVTVGVVTIPGRAARTHPAIAESASVAGNVVDAGAVEGAAVASSEIASDIPASGAVASSAAAPLTTSSATSPKASSTARALSSTVTGSKTTAPARAKPRKLPDYL